MSLETVVHKSLRVLELAASELHHDGLELSLPIRLIGVVHDRASSLVLIDHFEVFGVLKEAVRQLLLGDLEAAPLDAHSCLVHKTLVDHDPGRD